ncbi:scavenger receptor class B member 1 isoform X2 [Gallus gallus]|uniref:Scavenger receptor class B member 1 n=1 Tax=Gallus gallus TaxID=9031 RepID=F1NAN9_CHICK|nr:scavenger receptor class B member 1 isoform X2 [Gallus gallus]XP_015131111.1 scavenger receptor class B member 1 isoform X2 [Gallus gallus]XP_040540326.1 scavenger receptor class B member 1 isoform X2 [Gallus gallus]XP_040540327.1 scavenger receptor class B member 1 isoform X2 [Gallus gallus]|eukprot:XP_015131110.1 scavenger receptor class B member 1 isoform X2 [Gallus gallus]
MVAAGRRVAVGLGAVGAVCLLLGGCLLLAGPAIVKEQVLKNVRIDPSSISFNMWRDIPVPFYLTVNLFEVQNPQEVLQGAKPKVNQRGPYVYREFKYKTNITFHDNDTVSYLEYRQLFFRPDLSNGTEDEYIVMPNILMLGAAVMMENLPSFVKLLLSGALAGLKQEAFINRTVGEILWGYEDPLLDTINALVPGLIPYKGKFGIFIEFNNTNSGLFTVNTGMKNISQVHMVDSWNGLKKVNYWRTNECNMINGTAGEMWPPYMSPTSLEFYSPDACRSMTLVYEQSGKFKGVPTYRFVAPKTLFANGTDYPPNEGFCPCRQSGIQNVSSCRLNAPMFISHPHFYNADPSLVDAVEGLHPSREEHALFLDVHPVTGIPMNCSIKLQLNQYMKQVSGILQTGKIQPVVMPLLWFAESGYIDGSVLSQFYTNLVLIPSILDYLQYIFLGLSVPLIISAALVMMSQEKCSLFWSSNKKNSDSNKAAQAPPAGKLPPVKVLREARL